MNSDRPTGNPEADALNGLDPQQREAVLAPRGPVCILAGAGTGKTRTITRRIAHLVAAGHVRGDQVLSVTFTARAAGELRTRLVELGIAQAGTGPVQARTFHSAAMRNLAYFWPRVYGDEPWQLLDGKFRAVAQAVRRTGLDASTETIRDVLTEIDWAKSSLLGPEEYAQRAIELGRSVPTSPDEVARAFRAYEDLKVSGGVRLLDFDDLLSHTAEILEDVPDIAEEFRDRYRCFVVDEFQDVTPSQDRLLRAWLGRRDDLTVVGDVNQTIYTFAGAEPSFLLDFPTRFDNATVVRLESDYRSTPQVVELANDIISTGDNRFRAAGLTLRGMRPDGPEPVLTEYADDDTEAEAVAARIAHLVRSGTPASEIAVLYRINAQSERIEAALDNAGIGYRVRGGEGFFERPEIRRALSSLGRLVEQSQAGGEGPAIPIDEVIPAIKNALEPLGLTAAEPAGRQARDTWQSLTALVGLAEELVTTDPSAGLLGVVAGLRARAAARHAPESGGVILASIHAAKGLEWDAVFLIGVHEGGLPISHAIKSGQEAIEEERRLLYVGVTRAREHLHLSWSRTRNAGGRGSRRPSRFLDHRLNTQRSPQPALVSERRNRQGRGNCNSCGTKLVGATYRSLGTCQDCAEGLDVNLFDTLRQWRLHVSEAAHKPAYTVFTNETLVQIAQQRPTTTAELARVHGVGAQKLNDYGDAVLQVIRDHTRTG